MRELGVTVLGNDSDYSVTLTKMNLIDYCQYSVWTSSFANPVPQAGHFR